MKRLLISAGTLVFVGALAAGATGAFFSDTETSTGNVFAAGAIDLQIDNESYVTDVNGNLIFSTSTSWTLDDLTGHLFFNFFDLKPGDIGEDTISIHVNNNDAWLCAAAQITEDSDFTYTEPELDDDQTVNEADPENTDGELGEELNFVFWADDGDNVFEDSEEENESIFLAGPISALGGTGQIALADSQGGVFDGPIPGGQTVFIGKVWCFGDLTPNPVDDGSGPPTQRGTGFTCNGAEVNNAAQTDRVEGDIQFYAEQSRNNTNFLCSDDFTPDFPDQEPRELVGAALSAFVAPGDTCNDIVEDGQSIQAAINLADDGDVICVEDGTHDSDTYPLRLDVDNLTLIAVNGPTSTAVLPGGVIIDNSGVTLSGFHIDGESTLLGETFGVYVNTGATGATVTHNIIEGNDTNPSRGVVAATGLSGVTVTHNEISDWLTGVFLNPSSGMVVSFNTMESNGVGSANDGPVGNSIHHNLIANNTIEGVGVSDAGPGVLSLSVNFNNIYDNPSDDQMNNYDLEDTNGGFEVDAEDNWWGDDTPADNINGAGTAPIDFDPFETSAFPEN